MYTFWHAIPTSFYIFNVFTYMFIPLPRQHVEMFVTLSHVLVHHVSWSTLHSTCTLLFTSILLFKFYFTNFTLFLHPHPIPLSTLHSTAHTLPLSTFHSTVHTPFQSHPFHCPHPIPVTPIPLFTLHSTVHIPFQSHPFHCSYFIPLATFQSTTPTLHSSSWSGPGLACESHWPQRTHAVMETT